MVRNGGDSDIKPIAGAEEMNGRRITFSNVMQVVQILVIPAMIYLGSAAKEIVIALQSLKENQIVMDAQLRANNRMLTEHEERARIASITRSAYHHTSIKSCLDCKVHPPSPPAPPQK